MKTVTIILLVVLAAVIILMFAVCAVVFNQVIWYKPIKLRSSDSEENEDDFAKDHRKAEEEFKNMPFEKVTLSASNGEKIYARILKPEKSNGHMIVACHGAHSSGICEFCICAPYFHKAG